MTGDEGVPRIEVIDLVKTFGDITAVDGVSFRVHEGEFVSLLGPSGCGKTTTLRMIAGFQFPDSGRILLGGRDVAEAPPYRRDVGLVFQSYALFPHMTVAQNVSFGPRMRRASRDEVRRRMEWALDLVRLPGFAERYPHELSGGQQQRVAVARVLAADASVLLLDEPFSNLDAKLRKDMQDELRELQRELAVATIHVTHDQEEAMSMSDRVIIMNRGRIEQHGSPTAVYGKPHTSFVAEFMGRGNRLEGTVVPGQPGPGLMLVEVPGIGRLEAPWPLERETPARAVVFVRPERVMLRARGELGAGTNAVPGVVRTSVYLGAFTSVHVDVGEGATIVAEIPNTDETPVVPEPGTPVDLWLPPGCLNALPLERPD